MSTNIQWTATVHPDGTVTKGETWNPIRAWRKQGMHPGYSATTGMELLGSVGWHCERVSEGCRNCYAEAQNVARRFALGTGLGYTRPNRDRVDIYLDGSTLTQPLRWRKPRKVFVCSMTDLFGEWVTDAMLDRVFAVMALTPHITYQVLTKRPERMRAYLTAGAYWPLPNVWLGVSVEDQAAADARIPDLLATPAAVRFLSCEPLLGPVHLDLDICVGCRSDANPHGHVPPISWVIVGGESGSGARPCDLAWIRGIVAQCRAAGTAVFVKQLGARVIDRHTTCADNREPTEVWPADTRIDDKDWHRIRLRDRHGGDMAEWPADLRVRQFPGEAS